jgi:hypothetical protein
MARGLSLLQREILDAARCDGCVNALVPLRRVGDKNCCQQENSEFFCPVFNDFYLWYDAQEVQRKRMVSWGCMTKNNILPA